MEMYDAGEMTIRNIVFPLQVDGESGHWHTTFQGSEISAEGKAALRDTLMTRTAKAAIKVRVPFTTITETRSLVGTGKIARAVATGVHQGNGNVLIDWGNGKS